MKFITLAIFTFSFSFFASANDNKSLVKSWIKNLPEVSDLGGDAGCEDIRFPVAPWTTSDSGIYSLKIGDKLLQPWLGIDGKVQVTDNLLSQDFTGGGIDTEQYRVVLELKKQGNRLVSVKYQYFKISGVIFKKQILTKAIQCSTNE